MGLETEFGMLGGSSWGRAEAVQKQVVDRMPFIRCDKRGAFLANGGRAYVDTGQQNEYCTPEVQSPEALVVHEMAGRKLMAEAADKAGQTLLCSNVDPVAMTTWGTHENYSSQNRIDRGADSDPLYIHLATRLPYTGSGGICPYHGGVSPVLSPRACVIRRRRESQGTVIKSLVYDKMSDYGDSRRNHFMCGESLMSHYASYLKYATTALVVAMLDQGLPFSPVRFRLPLLRVMNQINRDLSMSRLYELIDGRRFTVLDMQEALLESIERWVSLLPEWAPLAIRRWHQVLDDLRQGRRELSEKLDWLIYCRLLRELASEMELDEDMLRDGNQIMRNQNPYSIPHPDLRCLHVYRSNAIELYVSLHNLGNNSLFNKLERKGWARHQIPEVTAAAIHYAVTSPPDGRAARRAQLIRLHWQDKGICITWDRIRDYTGAAVIPIDALDPDCDEAPRSNHHEPRAFNDVVQNALQHFQGGDYHRCIELLAPEPDFSGSWSLKKRAELLYMSYVRSGKYLDMQKTLARLCSCFKSPLEFRIHAMSGTVHLGLSLPMHLMDDHIDVCHTLLKKSSRWQTLSSYDRLLLDESAVLFKIASGNLDGAETQCRSLFAVSNNVVYKQNIARLHCHLAKILYLKGKTVEAEIEVSAAIMYMTDYRLIGDLVLYGYPLYARVAENNVEAALMLEKAILALRQLNNTYELAKVLCIKARRLRTHADREKILELFRHSSAYKQCTLVDRIAKEWDQWVVGPKTAGPDDYWGL